VDVMRSKGRGGGPAWDMAWGLIQNEQWHFLFIQTFSD
jgi:hypothetical protein